MKTFHQWCEFKKFDLNAILEQPEKEEAPTSEGSTKRAGVRGYAYPPLYSRGQYPRSYMRPIAADAVTYQDLDKDHPKEVDG